MWTKVKTTKKKNILLKLCNEIDYKIMASTIKAQLQVKTRHMIYVFIFNMTCTSDKNQSLNTNLARKHVWYIYKNSYFYHDSFTNNSALIYGMSTAG